MDQLPTSVTADDADRVADTRRHFLRRAAPLAIVGGYAALASCGSETSPLANYPTPTPSGTPTATPSPTGTPTIVGLSDTDMLVMMQQLHYLQAEFYSRAVLGAPLAAALVSGAGTAGDVAGGRQVTFADPVLGDIAREIAVEKIDQVVRLRAVLGAANPARPAIDLGVDGAGVFTRYGQLSGEVVGPATYDVYASQEQFLLGAFLLEDPVMNAWRGISALMTDAASIDIAAGLLSTSAHHVGAVRNQLFVRGAGSGAGSTVSPLRRSTLRLSDQRDTYTPEEDDRGVSSSGTVGAAADIDPADGEGEIYGRVPSFTINVFYMTRVAATSGGFFPAGLNGKLSQSVTL